MCCHSCGNKLSYSLSFVVPKSVSAFYISLFFFFMSMLYSLSFVPSYISLLQLLGEMLVFLSCSLIVRSCHLCTSLSRLAHGSQFLSTFFILKINSDGYFPVSLHTYLRNLPFLALYFVYLVVLHFYDEQIHSYSLHCTKT